MLYERLALSMAGSARRIARIVGGMPAERLKTVLWFSDKILYKAFSSICMAKAE